MTEAIQMTEQQAGIVNSKSSKIKVKARAGTGKTKTTELFMKARPNETFFYAVFNRATAQEANTRMPPNSYNSTMHAHAFGPMGKRLQHKLGQNYRLREIVDYFGLGRNYRVAYEAKEILQSFLSSKDTEEEFEDRLRKRGIKTDSGSWDLARRIWLEAGNPVSRLPATHDIYLKQYQLSKPVLPFDWIAVDEAQDWNPVMLDILLNQKANQILVGDPYQQLYAFRGAMDALDMVEGEEHELTQSWRFNKSIAEVANRILMKRDPKNTPIQGMKADAEPRSEQWAILGRTNAGLMGRMISEVHNNPDDLLYFIGGKDGYRFDPILDVYHLYKGDVYSIKDQYIKNQFSSFGELEKYVEETTILRDNGTKIKMDAEMSGLYEVVSDYRDQIPMLVERVRTNVTETRSRANKIFGTCHKAKGQEFGRVEVLEDFYDYREYQLDWNNLVGFPEKQVQLDNEMNLLYVAVTRAEQELLCKGSNIGHIEPDTAERRAKRELAKSEPEA